MYKKKKIYNIDRRSFLKGMGSLMIPLPLFEFMLTASGEALAADGSLLPKRLLLIKSGNAPAWDGDKAKDITGNIRNLLTPLSFGANYQLSEATKTLANYSGLQDYMGFFSNGTVPFSPLSSMVALSAVPAGGISGHMHEEAGYPQFTGRRVAMISESVYTRDPGASGDQLLKNALNSSGKFIHANYCADAIVGPSDSRATMQYDASGKRIAATSSPRAIFLQLFSNFTTPNTTPDPAANLAFDKRKSVLDYLDKERLNFLNRELGNQERTMLTSHLDSIRELELRIATQAPLPATANCTKPAAIATDPGTSWTEQVKRIDLIIDLLAMALACDIVRHGTFRITGDQCRLPTSGITGKSANFHDCTHYNNVPTDTNDQIKVVSFITDKFFKLAAALKNKPEGTGNILDNTALAYLSEGGHGRAIDEANIGAHSLENICTIIAGRAGGIKTGSHVKLANTHTAKIILTLMKAVGYTGNTLGDVSGIDTNIWSG